jgi:lipoprotein signal peptidase
MIMTQQQFNWQKFKQAHYGLRLHFIWVFFLVVINLGISWLVRLQDIKFHANENPLGFFGSWLSAFAIMTIATWFVIQFRLFRRNFLTTVFVISGIYANFIEKLWLGAVADYLWVSNLYFNLADLQIVGGLVFLNLQVWLWPQSKKSIRKIVLPSNSYS